MVVMHSAVFVLSPHTLRLLETNFALNSGAIVEKWCCVFIEHFGPHCRATLFTRSAANVFLLNVTQRPPSSPPVPLSAEWLATMRLFLHIVFHSILRPLSLNNNKESGEPSLWQFYVIWVKPTKKNISKKCGRKASQQQQQQQQPRKKIDRKDRRFVCVENCCHINGTRESTMQPWGRGNSFVRRTHGECDQKDERRKMGPRNFGKNRSCQPTSFDIHGQRIKISAFSPETTKSLQFSPNFHSSHSAICFP